MAGVFVVVPTFRERAHVERLLKCFYRVQDRAVHVAVVNGDPGDETSRLLEDWPDERVYEIAGAPSLYWSGLVNLGLRHVLSASGEKEFVLIMNADVAFHDDILECLVRKARIMPRCQLAAVTIGDRLVVSSGVRVVSWALTINRHPLAGEAPENLPAGALIPVDFLPTRCTLIPFSAVEGAGLTAEDELPHYGADNEYTNRIRRRGYQPYIFTGARVNVDVKHTGTDVFQVALSLRQRVGSLFSIKSTANPVYRLRFVRLVYPRYAWPSAMALYVLRSLGEVLFGGTILKSVLRMKEAGHSGT